MVCNLYFTSRLGDNCRTFLQQLGFLHLSYLFAVVFQRSSQLFNFSGEKDAFMIDRLWNGYKDGQSRTYLKDCL